MIIPSLIESSMFFFPIKATHLLYRFFKAYDVVLVVYFVFFHCGFFRLESVISKKYTNTTGKDSKCTNTIDISIIWLCWKIILWLFRRLYWGTILYLFYRLLCGLCVDCSLLCNISSFVFFISATSLWPCAMRAGCFSRVNIIFSFSSVIFYLTQNPRGNSFQFVPYVTFCLSKSQKKNRSNFWTSCFWFG